MLPSGSFLSSQQEPGPIQHHAGQLNSQAAEGTNNPQKDRQGLPSVQSETPWRACTNGGNQ